MTDDEFKKHLYKRLEEDNKNKDVLTHQLYKKPKPQQKIQKKQHKY